MKLEIGAWNNLPHLAVVGQPQDFYLWVNDKNTATSSQWLKGKYAFREYAHLRNLFKKNKKAFGVQVIKLHAENKKSN
jgi:hypothetical protein